MGHFKSNVRDIEFNLFEVFGTDRVFGKAPFDDLDVETARGMIAEVAKLAEGPLAESFVDGDRNPPVFDPDTNSVTMPASVKKSFKTLFDSEWWRTETMPELGGQLVPRTLTWAVGEQVLGRTRRCTCTWPARRSPGSSTRTATRSRRRWPSA